MIDEFRGPTRWLSNFGTCNIWAFGQLVSTTEHAYQAAKCAKIYECKEILDAPTPGKAKRLGQKCVLRNDWEAVKDHVMYTLQRRKFANECLQKQLLDTGDQLLVEGNDWGDQYWGAVKTNPADLGSTPEAIRYKWWPPETPLDQGDIWLGQNQLGITLMQVRTELLMLKGL